MKEPYRTPQAPAKPSARGQKVRQPGAEEVAPRSSRDRMRKWAIEAAAREARVASSSRVVRVVGAAALVLGLAMSYANAQDLVAGIERYPIYLLGVNGGAAAAGAIGWLWGIAHIHLLAWLLSG